MGRLIDADVLKKEIHTSYSDDLGILEKIDKQPTVFDVDKFLEQLNAILVRMAKISIKIVKKL